MSKLDQDQEFQDSANKFHTVPCRAQQQKQGMPETEESSCYALSMKGLQFTKCGMKIKIKGTLPSAGCLLLVSYQESELINRDELNAHYH